MIGQNYSPSLLLIKQFFHPSDSATAVLLKQLVEDLQSEFDITVLCESSFPKDTPTIETGPMIIRLKVSAFLDGPNLTASFFQRLACCFIFLVRSIAWALVHRRFDIALIASEPPFLDTLLGLTCILKRQRFIIVVQDLYPELGFHSGLIKSKVLTALLAKIHSTILNRAARVITISKDHASVLQNRGVRNITIVPNWAAIGETRTENTPIYNNEPFEIHYGGNLGLACDLDALERTLLVLEKSGELDHFKIVIRGDGVKKVQAQNLAKRFDCVSLVPRVPLAEVSAISQKCQAQLILMPDSLFGCVFPSKFYSILASGKPVIASIPARSEMNNFIKELDVGYVASASNPEDLAEAFRKSLSDFRRDPLILSEMGRRGRSFVEERWGRSNAIECYKLIINSALIEKN